MIIYRLYFTNTAGEKDFEDFNSVNEANSFIEEFPEYKNFMLYRVELS